MPGRSLIRRVRRLAADTGGNATVEFVVLVPFLLYFFFALAEVGTLMARAVMLDRGLDMAVRDLRLGITTDVTHNDIKTKICEAAFLLSRCEESILLELSPLESAEEFPSAPVNCVDRTQDVEPVVVFDPGARSEIMFMRACLIADPLFPGTGIGAMLPKDASGGYAIIGTSAFVNEPA